MRPAGTPDADALGEDHTSFIQFEGMPVLSRAAIQLHATASSIEDDQPGFVSDDYLNAIAAETTTTALELEAAGMWERRDGGYPIVADEMVKVAIDFHERTDRQAAEYARHGEHLPPGNGRESGGWVICGNCGIPLERPDGGPVALPGGDADAEQVGALQDDAGRRREAARRQASCHRVRVRPRQDRGRRQGRAPRPGDRAADGPACGAA